MHWPTRRIRVHSPIGQVWVVSCIDMLTTIAIGGWVWRRHVVCMCGVVCVQMRRLMNRRRGLRRLLLLLFLVIFLFFFVIPKSTYFVIRANNTCTVIFSRYCKENKRNKMTITSTLPKHTHMTDISILNV